MAEGPMRPGPVPDEHNPSRARHFALAALLALAAAMAASWWTVKHGAAEAFHLHTHHSVHLFADHTPLASRWAPTVTGALMAGAVALLWFRVTAASWKHEPPKWRRDLAVVLILAVAAIASAFLWPGDASAFWGSRAFEPTPGATGPTNVEQARPGLGWWLAVVSVFFLVVSLVSSRKD